MLCVERRGFEKERGFVVQRCSFDSPSLSQPRLHRVGDTQVGISHAPKDALDPLGNLLASNTGTQSQSPSKQTDNPMYQQRP